MTNIKELERQYEQARSRHQNAEESLVAARHRLVDARIEAATEEMAARGIVPGTIVTNGKREFGFMGFARSTAFQHSTHPALVLHAVKKDGTISKRRLHPFGDLPAALRAVGAVTDAE